MAVEILREREIRLRIAVGDAQHCTTAVLKELFFFAMTRRVPPSLSFLPSLNHCHDYRAHLPDFHPGRTMPRPPMNRDVTDWSLARFEKLGSKRFSDRN